MYLNRQITFFQEELNLYHELKSSIPNIFAT